MVQRMMDNCLYEGGSPFFESGDSIPAAITLYSMKTEKRIQEPALVAAQVQVEMGRQMIVKCLAAGAEAQAYEDTAGAVVFSPFQEGRPTCYTKPVVCVRAQEHTTQIEEVALKDALLQAGAREVRLYHGSLAWAIAQAAEQGRLRRAVLVHIEPPV